MGKGKDVERGGKGGSGEEGSMEFVLCPRKKKNKKRDAYVTTLPKPKPYALGAPLYWRRCRDLELRPAAGGTPRLCRHR